MISMGEIVRFAMILECIFGFTLHKYSKCLSNVCAVGAVFSSLGLDYFAKL